MEQDGLGAAGRQPASLPQPGARGTRWLRLPCGLRRVATRAGQRATRLLPAIAARQRASRKTLTALPESFCFYTARTETLQNLLAMLAQTNTCCTSSPH